MSVPKKPSGCAIISLVCLAIISIFFWLYWNPWVLNDQIDVSGRIFDSETGEPLGDALIIFREFGWRGLPIPHSGGSLHDRRKLRIQADTNGRFSFSFKDDWVELVEIRVGDTTMPDFDVLFTNRNTKHASLDRRYFKLPRLAYPVDPELVIHAYGHVRTIPEQKWKWIHEFIPRDQLGHNKTAISSPIPPRVD